jgi:dCTP deaminase
MAILTGHEIRKQIEDTGEISISPYDGSLIQQNSLDVRLGTGVCVYEDVVYDVHAENTRHKSSWVEKEISSYEQSKKLTLFHQRELDVKRDNPVRRYTMDDSGWLVQPGFLYLMHVVEVLCAPNLVMTLDGRSSIARLGLTVHVTAGHAETGFHGQYTLEVFGLHPLRIYPGMSIAQVIFKTVKGEVEDYKERGNYVRELALGAQPSRSWRQFR